MKQEEEKNKILSQGAEGKVYEGDFFGERCIIKERFSKKYRNPELDARLTKRRLLQESRNMARVAAQGVRTPHLILIERSSSKIYMEYIERSLTLKQFIDGVDLNQQGSGGGADKGSECSKMAANLAGMMGVAIARVHNAGVIHGDLTTSNILIQARENLLESLKQGDRNEDGTGVMKALTKSAPEIEGELVMIDFGLSYMSNSAEDKGVDLYVLKRALISTHPGTEELFELIKAAYGSAAKEGEKVIKKFEEVERRGRKRLAFG